MSKVGGFFSSIGKFFVKYGPTLFSIAVGAYGAINPAVLMAHPVIASIAAATLGVANHNVTAPKDATTVAIADANKPVVIPQKR